jgi:hypothetical protein
MKQIFLDFNPNKALLIRAHYSGVSSDLSTTQATTWFLQALALDEDPRWAKVLPFTVLKARKSCTSSELGSTSVSRAEH